MITKIGILSDTHGFIHPGVVKIVNQCDIVIHAGDIIDEQTIQALKPNKKLIAIQGNNDYHISHLKEIEEVELPGGKLVIEHGHKHGRSPSHDSLRSAYPDAKAIVYGHTHKQVIDKDSTPWVINPGAAGKTRNHGGAKCLVIKIKAQQKWDIVPHIFD